MTTSAAIFHRLAAYAEAHPSLRAGQILGTAICHSKSWTDGSDTAPPGQHRCPYHIPNNELAALIATMETKTQ